MMATSGIIVLQLRATADISSARCACPDGLVLYLRMAYHVDVPASGVSGSVRQADIMLNRAPDAICRHLTGPRAGECAALGRGAAFMELGFRIVC